MNSSGRAARAASTVAAHVAPGPADPPRLAYRPREAAKALGCSHQLVYDMLRDGRLRSIVVGRARLIPADSLAALLAGEHA